MADFDTALPYVLSDEGRQSNDKGDHGGLTFWGISRQARADHRCPDHPSGVADSEFATPDGGKSVAAHIYRLDYWKFDGVTDQRVATKAFDIVVNCADPIRLLQHAVGIEADGQYGPNTEHAINILQPEDCIERMSLAVSDHYVAICLANASQMEFLRGWERRAIRRPR